MTVRVVALLFTLLLSGCVSSTSTVSRDAWAILPLSEASKLVAQCSRHSPTDASDFWTPSTDQIKALEQRLPALLRNSGHDIAVSRFKRQYIGFVRRGKKLIYLSAFPVSDTKPPENADWRNSAWIVCDGGDDYWGVEFDPLTQTFHDLDFNGLA